MTHVLSGPQMSLAWVRAFCRLLCCMKVVGVCRIGVGVDENGEWKSLGAMGVDGALDIAPPALLLVVWLPTTKMRARSTCMVASMV